MQNFIYKKVLLLLAICSASLLAQSQDSLTIPTDTIGLMQKTTHSPMFAAVSSAIIPGAGQLYNKKVWKIPIVYAGLAAAGYFIYYNGTVYSNFRKAYDYRIDNDETTNLDQFKLWEVFSSTTIILNNFEDGELLEIQDIYRQYLDLAVISAGAVYALNIIDAVVDAHLFEFDVSDDLSFDIQPWMTLSSFHASLTGVSLTIQF